MSDLDKVFELSKSSPTGSVSTAKPPGGGGKQRARAGHGPRACLVGSGCLCCRPRPDGLAETADAVTRLGRKGTSFAADVTDETQVEALMAFMKKTYGGLDILINSQGIVHLQPSTEFDTEAWQRVMDVNVKSIMLTCKHAGRMMLEKKKGKIINISSVRGFQGRAGDLAYAPSKGAVNQLTRSLAIEWGPQGINVNGIAPVFTLTAISAPILEDPDKRNWVLGRIPMKRLGELDDVFGPAVFLASEASNFVNGHTLPVDGGWLGA